jgi:hypothetical protein
MGINNAHSYNNGCLKVNLKPKVLPMKALHFTSYKINHAPNMTKPFVIKGFSTPAEFQ